MAESLLAVIKIIKKWVWRAFCEKNHSFRRKILEIRNLNAGRLVRDINLDLYAGEIVGIAGLMGAGRTELAMSIFGKSYGTGISGQVFIDGKEVKMNTVTEAIKNGLAYVTEDRKGNGLILSSPIIINTTLANLKNVSRRGVLDGDKEYAVADEYREKLKTKCPTVDQNVGN